MEKEFSRYITSIIEKKMKTIGAVVVAGPKFCGKTTTCMKVQNSFIKLNKKSIIESIQNNPEAALEGETPHLIDEWQTVPDIWNYVKDDLDNNYQFGKFILTGSSTPADKADIYHTGAGRIVTVKMKPLSLSESEDSNKSVSLSKLFDGTQTFQKIFNNKSFDDVLFYMCRGGWPLSCIVETKEAALEITQNYFSSLFNFENCKNEKFRNKNPGLLRILLKSCARHISAPIKATSIMYDVINGGDRETFDRKTYDEYLEALNDLFILDSIDSWNPNLRSKTIIITSPIMHFTDTSIACCALNATPNNLKLDLKTAGLLFEDMVIRDLSIYSSLINGSIMHYRDANGLECDAIITLPDGRWCAIDIKIGGRDKEDEGVSTLIKFMNKVETSNNYPKPSFAMVVTAFGQPRITKEGIYIVPITCLTN